MIFDLTKWTRASSSPADDDLSVNWYDAPGTHVNDDKSDTTFEHFVTRPDIIVPRWQITVHNETALANGYWFVAPYEDVYQEKPSKHVGPMIYDGSGELVWSGNSLLRGWNAFGFRRTEIDGKKMLSLVYNHEAGLILDDGYEIVKKSYVGGIFNPWVLNMHEFAIVDNGSKLLQMRSKELSTSREISAQIGYDGRCYVHFQGFEEKDVNTLETTFEWDAEGVIPLSDTFVDVRPVETRCTHQPYDYAHCNSLDKLPAGDYIIGCRHTDAVYAISHLDGSVLWRFGGSNLTKSDFEWINRKFRAVSGSADLANEWTDDSHFGGQHDVKVWEANDTHILLGMFDNAFRIGSEKTSNPFSRGLLIQLDLIDMTAEVVGEYGHPEAEIATGRGSFQLLDNDNAFVGFAEHSSLAEYAHDGTLLMQAKTYANMKSYRAYKYPWVGHPTQPPDVYSAVFVDDDGKYHTNIWISWNGATLVENWEIHRARPDAPDGQTEFVTVASRNGFETAITVDTYISHVVVVGLNRRFGSLGKSNVVKTVGPAGIIEGLDKQDVEWVQQHPGKVVEFLRRPEVAFLAGFIVCALTVLAGCVAWCCTRSRSKGVAWWKHNEVGVESDHLLQSLSLEMDYEDVQMDLRGNSTNEVSQQGLLNVLREEWDEESKQRVRDEPLTQLLQMH